MLDLCVLGSCCGIVRLHVRYCCTAGTRSTSTSLHPQQHLLTTCMWPITFDLIWSCLDCLWMGYQNPLAAGLPSVVMAYCSLWRGQDWPGLLAVSPQGNLVFYCSFPLSCLLNMTLLFASHNIPIQTHGQQWPKESISPTDKAFYVALALCVRDTGLVPLLMIS